MPSNATDVLIVGGGPAGLAASIALAQRGIESVVVEAGEPGTDKPCGEGLIPDAVASLRSPGVALKPADGFPFRGIRFIGPQHRAEAFYTGADGLGMRRTALHTKLADRALACGVDLRWRSRVKLQTRSSAAISSAISCPVSCQTSGPETLSFRWIIGADGHASTTRQWAGLDRTRAESVRYGFRTHFAIGPWSEFVEIHWAADAQAYVTPVAADLVCVVVIARDLKTARRSDGLAMFPELAGRLPEGSAADRQRGAVSATRRLHRVADHSVALLGDASGSADAITGEGLAMAFRQAHALADAIAAGSLVHYAKEHRRIASRPQAMGQALLLVDRFPALQARVLRALSRRPELFTDLLAIHTGSRTPLPSALCSGASFGWELLAHPFST